MNSWQVKISGTSLTDLDDYFQSVISKGIKPLAEKIHGLLIDKINTGDSSWPPLSEVTKWIKGSDQVLVNSGDFKNAIEFTVDGDTASIGILNPKGAHGQDMELIARVIEGGAVIPVTDKMRAWFAAKGYPLRKTTVAITIPARPVFGTSLELLDEKIAEVFGPLLADLETT